MIQLRRGIPAFSRHSFATQQRNYSARLIIRFTGVEFVHAFVSFSTKPEITTPVSPHRPVHNSISPLPPPLSRSCPRFSRSACSRFPKKRIQISLSLSIFHHDGHTKLRIGEVGFYPVIGLQRKLDYFKCDRAIKAFTDQGRRIYPCDGRLFLVSGW